MPVCLGCSASYEASLPFCPYCQRVNPEYNGQISTSNSDDCPLCKNNLHTRKVSSIVAAGTTRGLGLSSSSGNIEYRGYDGKRIGEGETISNTTSVSYNQNDLAKELAAPVEPQKEKPYYGGVLFIFGGLLLMLFDAPSICPSILIIIGVLSLVMIPINMWKKENEFNEKFISYKSAVLVWDQLFYCFKHDIVFMEGKTDYYPVSKTQKACYDWGAVFTKNKSHTVSDANDNYLDQENSLTDGSSSINPKVSYQLDSFGSEEDSIGSKLKTQEDEKEKDKILVLIMIALPIIIMIAVFFMVMSSIK